MIVVCDASPIIALSAIQRIGLLRELYGTVLIPEAVHDEVVQAGAGLPGAEEVAGADWITRGAVGDRGLVRALQLDPGESEAIVLALVSGADLLLVDERKARRTAIRLGLRVAGTLGLLVSAKEKGLLREIRPALDALVDRAGFRVSEAVRERILYLAGE